MNRLAGEHGSITPMAAVLGLLLMAFAAFAIDTGAWYMSRRALQGHADAAALAAAPFAADAADAQAEAESLLTANGLPGRLVLVETGVYCPTAPVTSRFIAGVAPCPGQTTANTTANAVRLRVRDVGPLLLGRLLDRTVGPTLTVEAIGARVNQAGLEISSGLVNFDTSRVAGANAVLGGLLGTNVNLSLVDYQGLVAADVSAPALLNQLASDLNLTAGSYQDVLAANITEGRVLTAAMKVLQAEGAAANADAITALQRLRDRVTAAGDKPVPTSRLFDLGPWGAVERAATTGFDASLNVLQLASLTLQAANGQNGVNLAPVGLSVPGVLSVQVESTLIEAPQTSYAFGPEGVTVNTAQVRLLLRASLLNGNLVNLPLYVEAAPAEATVTRIECSGNPATDAEVDVLIRTGVARVVIGEPDTPDAFTSFQTDVEGFNPAKIGLKLPLGPPPLSLPNLALLETSIRLEPPAIAENSQTFTSTQPVASQSHQVGSGGLTQSLLSLPASAVDLRFCTAVVLGQCILGGQVTGSNKTSGINTLSTLLTALDPLIDGLLAGLGIKLGYANSTITGVRCGIPVLVK
ncbi:pilus assembly protein TadG-related protein [Caulobacter sp. NIBR2454]|uniref:pilus assembly protein TadG-related protein n=1 Tax=Caulobacter sp. NIBR2454 TaxID=3015996 RepID=UPI0022B7245B|nr:pilus assembly protein TadG-related protein [Caulobacter sp. NIBR2454]